MCAASEKISVYNPKKNKTMNKTKDYGHEQVLAVPRRVLEAHFRTLPEKGVHLLLSRQLERLLNEGGRFQLRNSMEQDESFKQVIPYVVIRSHDRKTLVYRRGGSGGEGRLHGLRSLGFGGHINPIDKLTEDDVMPGIDVVLNAVNRELEEELGILPFALISPPSLTLLVNNDQDPVGRVHIGVVFYAATLKLDVREIGDILHGIEEPTWMTDEEIYDDIEEFEEWSKLVFLANFTDAQVAGETSPEPSNGPGVFADAGAGERRQRAEDDGVFPGNEGETVPGRTEEIDAEDRQSEKEEAEDASKQGDNETSADKPAKKKVAKKKTK